MQNILQNMRRTAHRGRARGKGRGRGRGREGYPIGTSASALAFAHSLLDDRSAPATASVLLLSWVPAWKQVAPHGPPTRHEGEVRRCGGLNVTFSSQRELLRHGGFDAIALIHHVRSMQRKQPLPHSPRAVNVMYSIEPPGWKPKLEPTHLAAFTRRFGLALSYEQARRASRPAPPGGLLLAPARLLASAGGASHQGAVYQAAPRRRDFRASCCAVGGTQRERARCVVPRRPSRRAPRHHPSSCHSQLSAAPAAPAVAAIVGNCAVAGTFPRHALLQQLMGVVRVDSLSSCLHNTGTRRVPTSRAQETAALLRYKFVLAVENSVCPDYITEKALRPYRVGAVPIVFEARGAGGAGDRPPVPNYAQYFPKGSYINAAAFDSFEALGEHLRAVGSSRELWMKYHAHRDAATAPHRLAEWRRQHRRAIGDPACRLAHRTLAFVRAGNRSGGVPPMDRCLPTRETWPKAWPKPTPPPARGDTDAPRRARSSRSGRSLRRAGS